MTDRRQRIYVRIGTSVADIGSAILIIVLIAAAVFLGG